MTTSTSHSEDLFQFPCEFPLKIMGANTPELLPAVAAILQQHIPHFDPNTLEARESSKGNFLALTARFNAQSREQLDTLYLALTAHPLVKVAL